MMTRQTLLSIAAITACSAFSAQAEEPVTEWRLMGPAFSHHFSQDGAAITKPASSSKECMDKYANLPPPEPFTSLTPIPGAITIGRTPDGGYIYMPIPAPSVMECETVVLPAERGWHGNNPALGLELTQRYEGHSNKFLVNFVRDSYGTPSAMFAAGRLWPLLSIATVRIDGGLVAGLWYRSVLNGAEDGLVRRLVPFALPSLAISDSYTGLGLDIGFAPRLSFNGYTANRTPTVMVQTTYLIKNSSRGWTAFQLGASEAGGVNASVAYSF